ncbi:MAG: UxaA family hydrolase [Lactovum sp.]
MKNIIKINESDNVVIALEDLEKGTIIDVEGQSLELQEDIPMGHKVAITDIEDIVIKYGFEIGSVTSPVAKGHLINEKNLHSNLENKKEWHYDRFLADKFTKIDRKMKIMGYPRENGDFGIRNDIWVIPTVGCINQIMKLYLKKYDDLRLYSHPYGCSQSGEDGENTLLALSQMIQHPNAGGVLVMGLGCENTQISMVQEAVGEHPRVRYVTLQEVDDESEEIDKAIQELKAITAQDKRVPIDASRLRIGVECGGSDGFSGITGNPLLGKFGEHMVTQENSNIVITEIPEFFGAEQCALNLCESEDVYHKLDDLFLSYREFYESNGIEVYANPSPGNKQGGISTLEEKSLGCINKIGNLPIVDVKDYGCSIEKQGTTVISSPGNDLVATTALGIAGCHLVLFTTGRGTPFGGFIPTMKISTNTNLATRKKMWIDFDAGRVLTDDIDVILEELHEAVEAICNGKLTRNEENESFDIAIFKTGVTL